MRCERTYEKISFKSNENLTTALRKQRFPIRFSRVSGHFRSPLYVETEKSSFSAFRYLSQTSPPWILYPIFLMTTVFFFIYVYFFSTGYLFNDKWNVINIDITILIQVILRNVFLNATRCRL
jgi:hypothetical protein